MKDRVFVDTDILIYLYSVDEPEERKMAEKLIADKDCVISVQVLNEFSSVCLRKLRIPAQQITKKREQLLDKIWVQYKYFIPLRAGRFG